MFRKINGRVYEAAGAEGGGAGGAGDDAAAAAAAAAAASAAAASAAAAAAAAGGGDKSKMTDKEHELLQEVMEKKAKLRDVTAALDALKADVKKFDGINIDEVRAMQAERLEKEHKALESKGEFDKVKAQMKEAHQADMKSLQDQIAALSESLAGRDSTIEELSIGHSFASSKFIAEKLVLPPNKARTIFGSHFERNATGEIIGYDKPKGAQNRAPFVNANGDPLAFEDAMAKLVERDPDKDQILRAAIKTGAGSGTTSGTGGTQAPAEVTGIGRIQAALSSGALQKTAARLVK